MNPVLGESGVIWRYCHHEVKEEKKELKVNSLLTACASGDSARNMPVAPDRIAFPHKNYYFFPAMELMVRSS
jgi:hypothetical protein